MHLTALGLSLLVGLVLILAGIVRLTRTYRIRAWPAVPAMILDSRIASTPAMSRFPYTLYFPEVRFRYQSSEGFYEGHRFSIFPNDYRSVERSMIDALLSACPVGQITTAYVCPADSHIAVLYPDVSKTMKSHNLALLVSGVLVLAVGLAAVLYIQ